MRRAVIVAMLSLLSSTCARSHPARLGVLLEEPCLTCEVESSSDCQTREVTSCWSSDASFSICGDAFKLHDPIYDGIKSGACR